MKQNLLRMAPNYPLQAKQDALVSRSGEGVAIVEVGVGVADRGHTR